MSSRDSIIWNMLSYSHSIKTSSDREYNIVLSCDYRLFNQLLVLIYMMVDKFKRPINLYILQNDFPEFRKTQLINFCINFSIQLSIIDVDINLLSGIKGQRLPKQCYFYLLSHILLPDQCERVLALDLDLYINKDIGYLYDIDFCDTWLAACNEFPQLKIGEYIENLNGKHKFWYRPFCTNEVIYNTGVVLLNLNKFRKNAINAESFGRLQNDNQRKTKLNDQFLLNRFTRYNIKLLPNLYFNCQPSQVKSNTQCFKDTATSNEVYQYYELDEELASSIIHFCGMNTPKPWHALKEITPDGKIVLYPHDNQTILEYVRLWWDAARNIPEENYSELVRDSIYAGKGYKLHNFTDNHNTFIKMFAGKNALGPSQAQIISFVIDSRCRKCNMLIFGASSPNIIWKDINKDGITIFMESDKALALKQRQIYQGIKIYEYSNFGNTVESTLNNDIRFGEMPHIMGQYEWDIIFIDGPTGYSPQCPGRALPIIWSSQVALSTTHIFIDDYNRPLEKHFTDKFLGNAAIINDPERIGEKMSLAWINGDRVFFEN